MNEPEFTRQVSDALSNLYDPVALREHPFARRPGGVEALRKELVAGIESTKPAVQVDPSSRAWRPYRILTLRYVEGRDAGDVAREIAIGRSQYYREHESAVAAVASTLRERGWDEETSPAVAARREDPRRWTLGGPVRWAIVGSLVLAAAVAIVAIASPATPPATRSLKPTLSVYAGDGVSGYANGPGATARFAGQFGLATDAAGNVYVADTGNNRVRWISTSGIVLDVAGSGIAGYLDGPSAEARFSSPNAVTVGPDGTVYVGDAGNQRIRAVSPSGVVSTLAGSGQAGYADGVGTKASFSATGAIISGPDGMLYVPDPANNVVRRITPSGVVSTYAGSGRRGHLDGPAAMAEFNIPQRGGGVDAAGNVYVLDLGDNRIRKVAPDGSVTTVAGTGVPGFRDGPVSEALFSADILGVITDAQGTLFVMDAGNRRVRMISHGAVSTIYEFTDPDHTPGNIKVDPSGDLFLSDRTHNRIYKLTRVR